MFYFSFFLSSFLSMTPQDSVSQRAWNDVTNPPTSYTLKLIIEYTRLYHGWTLSERLEFTACANFFNSSGNLPASFALSYTQITNNYAQRNLLLGTMQE